MRKKKGKGMGNGVREGKKKRKGGDERG